VIEDLSIGGCVRGAIDHAKHLDQLPILSEISFAKMLTLLGIPTIQDVNSTHGRPSSREPQRFLGAIQVVCLSKCGVNG
jgi:hypothetical protein